MASVRAFRNEHSFHPVSDINNAKRSILSRIHYPRLTLLVLVVIAFYFFLYGRYQSEIHVFLVSMGYSGIFLAGILYSYAFTAGPAALIFLSLAKNENIFLATFVGAAGCMLGDLIIFLFIRHEFGDELDRMAKTHLMQHVVNGEKRMFGRFQKYVLPAFASFCIGSPLPTEIGVALMASRRTLSTKLFMVIDYSLDATGIFLILLAGQAL